MLRSLIIGNSSGVVCFSHYFSFVPLSERAVLEREVLGTCLLKGVTEKLVHNHEKTMCYLFKRIGLLVVVVTADMEASESILREILLIFKDILTHHLKLLDERQIIQHSGNIAAVLNQMVNHGRLVETRPSHILSLLETAESETSE